MCRTPRTKHDTMSDVEKEKNMAANQNGSYAGKVAFVTGAGSGRL